MSRTTEQVFEDALSLDQEERARLAHELIVSLDGPPEEGVEEAWREEIERRAKEVEEGKVKLVPYEEVEEDVRKVLAKSRRRK